MENSFNNIINNNVNLNNLDKFAAIISSQPSKGARSPILWNSAFKNHGLNYLMVPLDVEKDNLFKLLEKLKSNGNFIGGALTTPHKISVAKWLGNKITKEAAKIGAVNCLYRNKNGELLGTNTDGEAAVKSFEKICNKIKKKIFLILGCGGAGKAVAAYFSYRLESGKQYIASRDEKDKNYANSLINSKWIHWSKITKFLGKVDVIINCTSLGFGNQEKFSPINKEDLIKLKKDVIVYDIIYQPTYTLLLNFSKELGLKTLNGLEMNFEQAVLAYNYAVPDAINIDKTRKAMKEVIK